MITRYAWPAVIMLAGIGFMALIIAMGPESNRQSLPPSIPEVGVMSAEPRTLRLSVHAHGTVVPRTESNLVSEVAGRVVAVSPAMVSGGFFSEGEVLVEIERTDHEVAVEQSQARLASARSMLSNAEKALRRQEDLQTSQFASESQYDDALNRLAIARAELREAEALAVRSERDLERTRLLAPYDGRVRSERVDLGQFIARGESIAGLYAIDFAEVRLPVHDRDLAFLPFSLAKSGDVGGGDLPKVTLRAEFGGGMQSWEAHIVRTEGELDPRTRMVNLIARMESPYEPSDGGQPLVVGLFVDAEILGREYEDVVVVPQAALHEGGLVHIVDDDDRLRMRAVDVLRVTDGMAYLKSGIRRDERISLSSLDAAVDGQQVRPLDSAQLQDAE